MPLVHIVPEPIQQAYFDIMRKHNASQDEDERRALRLAGHAIFEQADKVGCAGMMGCDADMITMEEYPEREDMCCGFLQNI